MSEDELRIGNYVQYLEHPVYAIQDGVDIDSSKYHIKGN